MYTIQKEAHLKRKHQCLGVVAQERVCYCLDYKETRVGKQAEDGGGSNSGVKIKPGVICTPNSSCSSSSPMCKLHGSCRPIPVTVHRNDVAHIVAPGLDGLKRADPEGFNVSALASKVLVDPNVTEVATDWQGNDCKVSKAMFAPYTI